MWWIIGAVVYLAIGWFTAYVDHRARLIEIANCDMCKKLLSQGYSFPLSYHRKNAHASPGNWMILLWGAIVPGALITWAFVAVVELLSKFNPADVAEKAESRNKMHVVVKSKDGHKND